MTNNESVTADARAALQGAKQKLTNAAARLLAGDRDAAGDADRAMADVKRLAAKPTTRTQEERE
jgi:hypothetical protein